MSRRQIRALALSCILALTVSVVPAVAATRDAGGVRDRDLPFIEKVMKRLETVIRAFNDTLTLPKP